MKKILLSLALALAAFSAQALQEIPIASASRISTGTATSADMYIRDSGSGPKDVGILVHSDVTVVTGSASLTLTIQGKTPQGTYYDVLSLTPIQAVVGTVNILRLRPGITATAGASGSEPLPPVFRVKGTITGTGSATYSVGVSRTN